MNMTEKDLFGKIQETPLIERIQLCKKIIGKLCAEGVSPKTSIPPQPDDEDMMLVATLDECLKLERGVDVAIGWLSTISSKDGSGHKDLAERLKQITGRDGTSGAM